MGRAQASVSAWIKQHLKSNASGSRSLIVTVFGDSVAPYSDGIWLSDLIELLEPLGANERQVRTSVFRLSEEGWLVARRDGRRSYYTLAPSGRRRFQQAYERVYTPAHHWDGTWTTVILPKFAGGAPERAGLRKELEWEGYAFLSPGIFARPQAASPALMEILKELKLTDRAVVFQARELDANQDKAITDLVTQCWNLEDVRARHAQFVKSFQPALNLIVGGAELTPGQAFVVQTLLIDAFRRTTLHDPRLPSALLPSDWPGQQAYQVCRDLYRRTYEGALEHLSPHFSAAGAPSHKAPAELLRRFGGLEIDS